MTKIGAITIGQAPRTDVTYDILPILGDNIELLQAGGLDGLTKDDIAKFAPVEGDYVLVSKLTDGTSVKFAERYILPRLQECINNLEKQGVSAIMFLCTGDFPDVFTSKVPLIFPCKILNSVVPLLANNSKIAVVTPDTLQIKQSQEKWKNYVKEVTSIAGSPYGEKDEIIKAAEKIKALDVDIAVMDCIGYTEEMKKTLREISGKNVILSRSILARVIREMID